MRSTTLKRSGPKREARLEKAPTEPIWFGKAAAQVCQEYSLLFLFVNLEFLQSQLLSSWRDLYLRMPPTVSPRNRSRGRPLSRGETENTRLSSGILNRFIVIESRRLSSFLWARIEFEITAMG